MFMRRTSWLTWLVRVGAGVAFVTTMAVMAADAADIPKPAAVPALTPMPAASFASPSAARIVPAPPEFAVLRGYILLDANSGYVITAKNPDERMPPASITKLMSLYIFADALKRGELTLDTKVTISETAWRVGGSKMFVKVGTQIPVRELIDGIVIASGNDATVAMAEHMAGTEGAFTSIMNKFAAELGMTNTHYSDSNGLPADNHYSTPRDIATLARNWIANFPEYYPWFKQKWVEHNGIKQSNRNRLLWHDASVDGIKTGHTDDAGYCLAASAVRNGTRLVAVVMGAPSDNVRLNDTEALLDYGFRFYETHKLYAAGSVLAKHRVWFGQCGAVELGLQNDLYATIPSGQYAQLKANLTLNKNIVAPLQKGAECGSVEVVLNGKVIAKQPVVALSAIPKAGFFRSTIDRLVMLFGGK